MANSTYSEEFKLKVVKYYFESNKGYVPVAEHFGISDSSVLQWVRKYKELGDEAFKPKHVSFYSGDFKKEVIDYMRKNKLSYLQTAMHFNLGSSNVPSDWLKIYKSKGLEGLYNRKKPKKSKKRRKKRKYRRHIENNSEK